MTCYSSKRYSKKMWQVPTTHGPVPWIEDLLVDLNYHGALEHAWSIFSQLAPSNKHTSLALALRLSQAWPFSKFYYHICNAMKLTLGPVHMGPKSQHGVKVPTFGPQQIINYGRSL